MFARMYDWTVRRKGLVLPIATRGIPKKEAKGLLTYAFANNVLESVAIPALKTRINKLIAMKLGVEIGHDL